MKFIITFALMTIAMVHCAMPRRLNTLRDDPTPAATCYDSWEKFKDDAKEKIHHIHLIPELYHELHDLVDVCKDEVKGQGECGDKLHGLEEVLEKIVVHHHVWDLFAAGKALHDAYEECKIHHYDNQPVYLPAEIKDDPAPAPAPAPEASCHDTWETFKDQAKSQVHHLHQFPDILHELKNLYEVCKTEVKADTDCDSKLDSAKEEVEKIVIHHHFWDVISAGKKLHDAYEACKEHIHLW